jgi:hypothetical protein
MKKLSVLFVAIMALGMSFTSCSKDDDETTSASIEGKWNYSKVQTTLAGQAIPEQDYPSTPGCSKDYLEFKADGVANLGYYEDSACKLDLETTKWTKDGNKLTIVSDEVYEIVSITNTILKIKYTYSEGGVSYSVTLTLVRA